MSKTRMTLEQLDAAYQLLVKMMAGLSYEEQERGEPWSRVARMARALHRLRLRIAEVKGVPLIHIVKEWICWDASDHNYSDEVLLVTTDEKQADDLQAERNEKLHEQFGSEGAGCYILVAADGYEPVSAPDMDVAVESEVEV